MMPGRRLLGQWGTRRPGARRARIAAVAGAILVAAAAGLTALGARFATPPPPQAALVDWRAGDGTTFHLSLDAARFDRFLEQRALVLAQERRRLQAIVTASTERELATVYGTMTGNIPRYTDWVYSWIENYITTYLVIGRTVETMASPPPGTAALDVFTTFRESMRSVISEHFAAIVIEPADPQRAMAAAAGRLEALLAAEWRHVLDADSAAWDSFLLREGRTLPRADAGARDARCAIAAPAALAEQAGLVETGRIDGEQADLFAVRLARPPTFFVFRVGLAPFFSTGSVIAVTALATPTSAATLAATTATLWTLDFFLNQLDGVLHRAAFEGRLITAIDAVRQSDTAALTARLDEAVTAAFTALAGCRNPIVTAAR